MKPNLRLFHYWRSSSSWRVRWALELKEIPCELIHLDLLKGETKTPEHLARNPMGFVPVLEVLDAPSDRRFLSESMAIVQWLDQLQPSRTPLMPSDPWKKAQVIQLAEILNSGTQPLQHPLLAKQLFGENTEKAAQWSHDWNEKGLAAYEKLIQTTHGKYSVGDSITIADLFLVPQCFSAVRFKVDLSRFPAVSKIYETARAMESCKRSSPEAYQPKTTS